MYSPEQAPKKPDKEKQHTQKGAQVMEPIAIDIWMSYSSHMSPEVQEVRQRHSDEVSIGHQMAIPSYQRQLSGNWHVPLYGESRWHQRDTIYGRHSFMNDEHMRWAEDPSGMDEMGDVHVLWQVKHLGRYMGVFMGHQMDVALVQVQLFIRSNTLGDGEMRGCHGDMVYDKCLYMNMVSGVNDNELCHLSEKVVNR
jgi:hypothetical protein